MNIYKYIHSTGGGYLHVMCHMRRSIHACHVSYEEEDTCMSCVI
jgi:hypothetical protein